MLVFGSIYKGAILVHVFEPQPNVFCNPERTRVPVDQRNEEKNRGVLSSSMLKGIAHQRGGLVSD